MILGGRITLFAWRLREPGENSVMLVRGTIVKLGGNYDVGIGPANKKLAMGWN
ncbi:hypothetical protein LCGC14_0728250 [marine sediment metagenome]|uniref:Uncharacterized protein n=1 Tax=marine sediment metagenome TaxID=412755 RepID=A0A0F9QAF2_9ZZZZ